MVRDPAEPTRTPVHGPPRWRRRRVLLAIAALVLAVAGVLEFGFEVRVPWLAMIFWMSAVGAVIVACSGLGGSAVGRF